MDDGYVKSTAVGLYYLIISSRHENSKIEFQELRIKKHTCSSYVRFIVVLNKTQNTSHTSYTCIALVGGI